MKRKGITPVIAIVLLLLITVGAVGVVYTQFQSLVGNPSEELDQQQKVQNTDLTFSSVYKDEGDTYSGSDTVNITLRNTGDVAVNMTEQFELSYSPEGSSGYLGLTAYPDSVSGISEPLCFNYGAMEGDELVEPGDSYTCNTGVLWPGATNSVGFEVSFKSASKSWSYTCSPSTSSALAC
jgi:flagellin-like protein